MIGETVFPLLFTPYLPYPLLALGCFSHARSQARFLNWQILKPTFFEVWGIYPIFVIKRKIPVPWIRDKKLRLDLETPRH